MNAQYQSTSRLAHAVAAVAAIVTVATLFDLFAALGESRPDPTSVVQASQLVTLVAGTVIMVDPWQVFVQ